MSELYIVSDAWHPVFKQCCVDPLWIFLWPAVQMSSMKTFSAFWPFKLVNDFLTRKQIFHYF